MSGPVRHWIITLACGCTLRWPSTDGPPPKVGDRLPCPGTERHTVMRVREPGR